MKRVVKQWFALLLVGILVLSCATITTEAKKKKKKVNNEVQGGICALDPSSVMLGNNITIYKAVMYSNMELKELSCIIQAEAGNQPYAGKVGVGNVVLNRVNSDRFPNSIHDVIYSPYQFSPIDDGSFARYMKQYKNNGAQLRSCRKAAIAALNGRNYIGDFLYFRTVASMTEELRQKNADCHLIIGDHYFHATY